MKRILLAATFLFSTAISSSFAADMDYPIRPAKSYTNVEYGSGWYLRGDIGYTLAAKGNLTYYSDARYDYDNQSLDKAMSWGGGFGYTFNEMLRGDISVEMSGSHDWEGSTQGTLCGGVPGDCYSEDSAKFDRTTAMANAYVSLGRYGGFSPYIGAGIGLTHVAWSDYTSQAYCTVDPGEDCDYGTHTGATANPETYAGPATTYSGKSSTVLTYALSAGVDYRLNQNWLVDMGYKWTRIDGGVVIEADSNGVGDPQGDSKFDALDIHEFKIGLRYEIW